MEIKDTIHRFSRKLGYDFRRYTPENFPSLKRVKIIKSENINLALDIGASEGFYGIELRECGYTGRIISFEPLAQSYESLKIRCSKDKKWDCFNVALGDVKKEVEMSVSGHVTSSSLLPMTEAHISAMPPSATISKERIVLRTLDSFLGSEIKHEERIYMKIDVQGFEMLVLKGAEKILNQVVALELELSLAQLYQGGPLFIDMLKYMEELGFMVVSLNHVFSDAKTDQLLQVDGIFKRKAFKIV